MEGELLTSTAPKVLAGWQITAAFAGAVIPVALTEKISIRKALTYIVVGAIVSYFVTPLFTYSLSVESMEVKTSVSFLVGMIGCQLAHAIISQLRSKNLQTLIAKVVERRVEK